MALRMIEVTLSPGAVPEAQDILRGSEPIDSWVQNVSDNEVLVRGLFSAEDTEEVIDALQKRFQGSARFRIVLIPVEASIPRPEKPKEEKPKAKEGRTAKPVIAGGRVSREELYRDVVDTSKTSNPSSTLQFRNLWKFSRLQAHKSPSATLFPFVVSRSGQHGRRVGGSATPQAFAPLPTVP